MKKETKIISAITIVFLVVVFTICGLTIKNSPLSGYPRQIHDQNMTVKQFVSQVAPAAQREQKKYGIPASITIAQAGLESQWGNSRLGNKYNNLFGMKASKGEDNVRMYTIENINGKQRYIPQYFAVYQTWDDSIKAHTNIIVNGTKDNHHRFDGVRTNTNYRKAAQELQKNGYATDPNYANKLIYAIQKFGLERYDK